MNRRQRFGVIICALLIAGAVWGASGGQAMLDAATKRIYANMVGSLTAGPDILLGTSTATGTALTTSTGTYTGSATLSATASHAVAAHVTGTGSSARTDTRNTTTSYNDPGTVTHTYFYPSHTFTGTMTRTGTVTPTATLTGTNTVTVTITQTGVTTITETASVASYETRTLTATTTLTGSSGATATKTWTLTASASVSAIATGTNTVANTATVTASGTGTGTGTATATHTVAGTASGTWTTTGGLNGIQLNAFYTGTFVDSSSGGQDVTSTLTTTTTAASTVTGIVTDTGSSTVTTTATATSASFSTDIIASSKRAGFPVRIALNAYPVTGWVCCAPWESAPTVVDIGHEYAAYTTWKVRVAWRAVCVSESGVCVDPPLPYILLYDQTHAWPASSGVKYMTLADGEWEYSEEALIMGTTYGTLYNAGAVIVHAEIATSGSLDVDIGEVTLIGTP